MFVCDEASLPFMFLSRYAAMKQIGSVIACLASKWIEFGSGVEMGQ